MALRVVLVFSGLCLFTVRWTADARADLQARVEQLQAEVVYARGAVAHTLASCAAPAVTVPAAPVVTVAAGSDRSAQSTLIAARSLQEAPRGADACARMEDADAKVVSALAG